jgi:ribose transport system permease protein
MKTLRRTAPQKVQPRDEAEAIPLFKSSDLPQRFALLLSWAVLVAIFGALRPSSFLTWSNFGSMFGSQAVLVVLTLGLLLVLRTGDYDLSIASVLTMSSMMVAVLNVQANVPIMLAVLAALAMGLVVGFLNGAFAILVGIDPLVVTLGMGTLLQGLVLWISNSEPVSGISPDLVDWVVGRSVFGVPIEFYYGLVLAILVWYLFERTPLGRRMLFVGRNRDVARLSGIRVNRVRWGALTATGLISAFAGVLYAGTTGAADATSGLSFLLPAWAAAFLGATSIIPGQFNPWGSLIAVYFLVTGINGLAILGVETFVQSLFYGGALIIAVTLSQFARRRAVQRG